MSASRRASKTGSPASEPRTRKGAETRERIVHAALELFEELGFDETTMRMVADRAGVSVGNAYYYYRSKELLLQAYYVELNSRIGEAVREFLGEERKFGARMQGVLERKLEIIEPYHRFSGALFRTAADPQSPLNPFHDASADMRAEGIQLWKQVIDGARLKLPKDLAARLPELLWTYDMGIVLFWIYDQTEDRERTRRLIEHTSDLVARLVRLASHPLLRPVRSRTLKLLEDIAPMAPASPGNTGTR